MVLTGVDGLLVAVYTLHKTLLHHPDARRMASNVDDLLPSTVLSKTCSTGNTGLSVLPHTVSSRCQFAHKVQRL